MFVGLDVHKETIDVSIAEGDLGLIAVACSSRSAIRPPLQLVDVVERLIEDLIFEAEDR